MEKDISWRRQSLEISHWSKVRTNFLCESLFTFWSIASRVDTLGNAQFNGTSRNFNPPLATAGKICILEADEIVQPGEIRPEDVHLPGIYVDRIVKSETERVFEKKTFFVQIPCLFSSLFMRPSGGA